MTLKWKWLVSYVLVILVLMMAAPAVTQADGTEVNGVLPLTVSGVAVSGITGSGATITWTTNGAATSQVFYDTVSHANVADYAHHTTLDTTPVSNHSQNLSGLQSLITYYFRVQSTATVGGNYFAPVSADYTFTTQSGGGGGGGGGGGVAITTIAGVTDITNAVDTKGVFKQSVYAWSDDNKALIYINSGTTGLNPDGTPLTKISNIHMTVPPVFQAGAGMITLAYDITPSGATFNPSVIARFSYDPALIPAGVAETSLQIAYYDSTLSAWVTLPCTFDTTNHFIFAQITHFTPYAVTYGVKAVTPLPTTTTTTTSPPPWTTTTTTTNTTTTTTTMPTTFNVSKLTVSPAKVNAGQKVTISVLVQNTGDVSGNYEVALKIDSVVTDRKILNLAAGTKDTVTFTVSPDKIGEHAVDVNGLSGKFTVAGTQTTTPPPAKKIPPWVIAVVGSVLFVIVVIAAIIIRLRAGRKT